jgi:hypothetical protein
MGIFQPAVAALLVLLVWADGIGKSSFGAISGCPFLQLHPHVRAKSLSTAKPTSILGLYQAVPRSTAISFSTMQLEILPSQS